MTSVMQPVFTLLFTPAQAKNLGVTLTSLFPLYTRPIFKNWVTVHGFHWLHQYQHLLTGGITSALTSSQSSAQRSNQLVLQKAYASDYTMPLFIFFSGQPMFSMPSSTHYILASVVLIHSDYFTFRKNRPSIASITCLGYLFNLPQNFFHALTVMPCTWRDSLETLCLLELLTNPIMRFLSKLTFASSVCLIFKMRQLIAHVTKRS